MSFIALGLDLGLEETAIAIVKHGDAGLELIDRTLIVKDVFVKLFYEVKGILERFKIAVITCEDLFFSGRRPQIMRQEALFGIIKLLAQQYKVHLRRIKPRQAKMALTGSVKASKMEMCKAAMLQFGLDEISHHEADAIALAIAGLNLLKLEQLKRLNKKE